MYFFFFPVDIVPTVPRQGSGGRMKEKIKQITGPNHAANPNCITWQTLTVLHAQETISLHFLVGPALSVLWLNHRLSWIWAFRAVRLVFSGSPWVFQQNSAMGVGDGTSPLRTKLNVDFILKQSCFACHALSVPAYLSVVPVISCLLTSKHCNMIIQHL